MSHFSVREFKTHRADKHSSAGGITMTIRYDVHHRRRTENISQPIENMMFEFAIRKNSGSLAFIIQALSIEAYSVIRLIISSMLQIRNV